MTPFLQLQLLRLWRWWTITPPPNPGRMSDRWLTEHTGGRWYDN